MLRFKKCFQKQKQKKKKDKKERKKTEEQRQKEAEKISPPDYETKNKLLFLRRMGYPAREG